MRAGSESNLLRQVRDFLGLTGWFVVRLNSGAFVTSAPNGRRRFVRFNSEPGCSDLMALRDGVVLFVEVKGPNGRLSPAQASFLEAIRRHGGLAVCVRSLDELQEELLKLKH